MLTLEWQCSTRIPGRAWVPCGPVFTLAPTEMPTAGLVPSDPSTHLAAASTLLRFSVFSHSLAISLLFMQGCWKLEETPATSLPLPGPRGSLLPLQRLQTPPRSPYSAVSTSEAAFPARLPRGWNRFHLPTLRPLSLRALLADAGPLPRDPISLLTSCPYPAWEIPSDLQKLQRTEWVSQPDHGDPSRSLGAHLLALGPFSFNVLHLWLSSESSGGLLELLSMSPGSYTCREPEGSKSLNPNLPLPGEPSAKDGRRRKYGSPALWSRVDTNSEAYFMPWDQAEVVNHALSGHLSFCSGHCSVPLRPPPGLKDLPPAPRVLSLTAPAGSPRKSSGQPSSKDQLMQAYTHTRLATTWDKAEGSLHLQALSGVNWSPHRVCLPTQLYLVGGWGNSGG